MPNPPPKEDTWAFQPIGAPFPDAPVKVMGEQNQYVALWYKHGVPIHGRAWNNGGVVECSFPYKKAELTGAKDLGGQIQILTYKGDHNSLCYWYEWIKYSDRFAKLEENRQLVKCGQSMPILWKGEKGNFLGYVDNNTEKAMFSHAGAATEFSGGQLNGEFYIIMRNFKCSSCGAVPPRPGPRVMTNEWLDAKVGDPWPTRQLVKALDKTLDTIPGQNPDQYVALWYQAGEPVMGRVWNEGGKLRWISISLKLLLKILPTKVILSLLQIAANFAWVNREFTGNVGSLQLLVNLSEHVRGFDYHWKPFSEVFVFGTEREFVPVHVNHHKGDISPAVITFNGKQILGKCDVRNEKCSAGFGGKENQIIGPAVHPATIVLARKARKGYKFD